MMFNKSDKTKQTFFLSVLVVLLISIIIMLWQNQKLLKQGANDTSWGTEKKYQYANKLKAEGLTEQAILAFEEYLGSGNISAPIRSNIYYSLGEMLYQGKDYLRALGYFYKAEIAYPQTELKKELGTYIVQCLENLNRTLDAKYQLESRTLLPGEQTQEKPAGEVIARIGKQEITIGQINKELAQMPKQIQDIYAKDKAALLEFVKQYVCNELLYEKGVRLGMRADPKVREKVETMTKQIIVQKVMENEVQDKLTQDSADIENYYKANLSKYTQGAKLKIKQILVDSQEKAQKIQQQLEQGEDFAKIAKDQSQDKATRENGGEMKPWISEQDYSLAAEYGPEFIKKLFAQKDTDKYFVLESKKGFHVIQRIDKQPERVKPFSEIKNQVAQEYSQKKIEKITKDLLDRLLSAEEVTIFEDKIKPEKSQNKDKTKKDKGKIQNK